MASESLIVELDARTSKLDAKLNNTQKRMDNLDNRVAKTDKSFSNFTATVGKAALAVTAVASAVALAVRQANQFAIELDVASNRAGVSVEEMQSLAFATSTVGISMEKIGDIAKDTQEKVGEFLATGGGGFKDFVDVMQLTQIEANAVAQEFANMSGPDVLQEMVRRMEEAGISGQKMSFALEGMASDATDLIPLLKNNAEGLNELTTEFDGLNVALSAADVEKIKEVGLELDKASSTFSLEGKQLIAEYSDEIINAINAVVFFAQKTTDAFNFISTGLGTALSLAQAAVTDVVNGTNTFFDVLAERQAESQEALAELLGKSMEELGFDAGQKLAEGIAQGLEDSNKPLEIMITKGKELTDWEKLNSKQRLDTQQKFIRAASILSNEYLEENKAINAGLVVADTAAGVMKAFATSSNIYEAFANAAIVAATGIVQLNNVLSAQKGGGSVSGGSGGGSTISQGQQATTQQETSTLELTEQSEDGVQTMRLIISDDAGNDYLDTIANGLNERTRQGR